VLAARDRAKAGGLNGGFMRFSWTIYPGPKAQVGWYLYATNEHRDTPLCGDPQTPLAQFANVIEGHRQAEEFRAEVRKLGLQEQLAL